MKYETFKENIENGKCFPVLLFEGEETFFFNSGEKLLKERFVQEPSLNFVSLNGDCSLNDLLSSLEGYPFMSEKRLTVVKEFYPKADFMKGGLKGYIENPSPDSILLILNTKPSDQLKKANGITLVECIKADTASIIRWIKEETKKSNLEIDTEASRTLCEYCLNDMTRIRTELDKLISYAIRNGAITKQDVDEMVNRDAEYKIYEMTDYVGKKKFDKALSVITEMINKGTPMQVLLVSIYNYFRRLLLVTISDMTISEMAKAFNIKEFAVRKAKEQASLFKVKALKNVCDMLSEADYSIKCGKSNIDEKMWLVIFKIMTEK